MNLKQGDLCIFANFTDFDHLDHTVIGVLDKKENGFYYMCESKRGYKHIRKLARNHPWKRVGGYFVFKSKWCLGGQHEYV